MIVCIGERVNDRSIPDARVERWRLAWQGKAGRATTMDMVRFTPAMAHGATMRRLESVLGVGRQEIQVWNLLPPDNKPGTWDEDLAFGVGMEVCDYLVKNCGPEDRVVMMGKRVSRTLLNREQEFGEVKPIFAPNEPGFVDALLIPHPSGRNRFWNNEAEAERIRAACREYLCKTKSV